MILIQKKKYYYSEEFISLYDLRNFLGEDECNGSRLKYELRKKFQNLERNEPAERMVIEQKEILKKIDPKFKVHLNPNKKNVFLKAKQIYTGHFSYLMQFNVPIDKEFVIDLDEVKVEERTILPIPKDPVEKKMKTTDILTNPKYNSQLTKNQSPNNSTPKIKKMREEKRANTKAKKTPKMQHAANNPPSLQLQSPNMQQPNNNAPLVQQQQPIYSAPVNTGFPQKNNQPYFTQDNKSTPPTNYNYHRPPYNGPIQQPSISYAPRFNSNPPQQFLPNAPYTSFPFPPHSPHTQRAPLENKPIKPESLFFEFIQKVEEELNEDKSVNNLVMFSNSSEIHLEKSPPPTLVPTLLEQSNIPNPTNENPTNLSEKI